jgi:hypothetical protein
VGSKFPRKPTGSIVETISVSFIYFFSKDKKVVHELFTAETDCIENVITLIGRTTLIARITLKA